MASSPAITDPIRVTVPRSSTSARRHDAQNVRMPRYDTSDPTQMWAPHPGHVDGDCAIGMMVSIAAMWTPHPDRATFHSVLSIAYDNDAGEGDLSYSGGSLLEDPELDLETAVLISLHCDAPAPNNAELPEGTPRRGWWGDSFDDGDAGVFGSLLWLLDDAVVTEATASRARGYVSSALKWLVDDGRVLEVGATTKLGDESIGLIPWVRKKDGDVIRFTPLQVGG